MARIYPMTSSSASTSSSSSSTISYMTSKRETFTLWMKSLVFQGNGCTVFDSNGRIIYRIDNYNKKSSSEVHLMDLQGKVLFSLRKKKFSLCGHWNGYKMDEEIPCFEVRKNGHVLWGELKYDIIFGCDIADSDSYRIVALQGKPGFKIVSTENTLIAEVKQKQLLSNSAVQFGDDVLSLVVEPHVDHSLVMALVTVYGLIQHML
ncbi:protein LURP-one-related 4-like [Nicotiana tomentosiformis]|uniref:protein LURP-one-related 4-like n=1 Tax=Nicotiana tomentosiformis TaxID=4098 RepID=UPI00051C1CFA|nr:protein LURP-one-related 4-like [Nicotiana tomentosiformis]